MKTEENSTQNNLVYQKQLLSTLNKIVSFRTDLLKNVVTLANEGKEKEWPSLSNQVKFIRKHIETTQDNNVKKIFGILRGLEKPILELEKSLELKNDVLQILSEQTLSIEEEAITT